MIYPTALDEATYKRDWYNAQSFGNPTNYGFHEGCDINTRAGGDTDLGKPLYAVADGVIRYWHNGSHPKTGFGKHMVLECETKQGKLWFHYAHCDTITPAVVAVRAGQQIGTLGKSGTPVAHLHFSCFIKDPALITSGIDVIAKTKEQLTSWWADPLQSLQYVQGGSMANELEVCMADRLKFWQERDAALALVAERDVTIARLEADKKNLEQKNIDLQVALTACENKPTVPTDPDMTKWELNGLVVTNGNNSYNYKLRE